MHFGNGKAENHSEIDVGQKWMRCTRRCRKSSATLSIEISRRDFFLFGNGKILFYIKLNYDWYWWILDRVMGDPIALWLQFHFYDAKKTDWNGFRKMNIKRNFTGALSMWRMLKGYIPLQCRTRRKHWRKILEHWILSYSGYIYDGPNLSLIDFIIFFPWRPWFITQFKNNHFIYMSAEIEIEYFSIAIEA